MKILFKSTPRACGTCTLCCKVMAIPELEKPMDRWCAHAQAKRGCAIYTNRPQSCQDFDCLWLQGLVPEHLSPHAVHAVVRMTVDGKHLVVHEDPGYRGVGRRLLKELIDRFIADGQHYVIIGCGEERVFLGSHALLAETLEKGGI